ncbi:S-adenosylmethionine decarboxylase [Absidia repens]|uniref:adenosylmethionine decarboxylase n=1 Tax=Absidia repens TaxID=90262 RepID=A0A1X2I045_9FUNG|nr:S-adenosylmethionine decarboxylase [Absidia repens]
MVAAITTDTTDLALNACTAGENYSAQEGAFEGPEKLLEIWFSPAWNQVSEHQHVTTTQNLMMVPRPVWEDMLAIVKCTVLNMIQHDHVDAYLLSESSMFVYPHKMIIKTCGTTTLLLALPRILEIAKEICGFDKVWRVFYSRKAFMFPDRQVGPHKSWESEVAFLDQYFDDGSAYKIGNMTGDHWHLYTTKPADDVLHHQNNMHDVSSPPQDHAMRSSSSSPSNSSSDDDNGDETEPMDQTVEIMMTKLNPKHMERYFYHQQGTPSGVEGGQQVDRITGIDQLYPGADVDSFLFEPCGYSSNGLWQDRYFTIHVTPEPQCSYASFETNIPISATTKGGASIDPLVQQVLRIFDPAAFSVTYFSSASTSNPRKMMRAMTHTPGYQRTDRILYEFDGYDLVYGHYVKTSPPLPLK